MQVLVRKLDRAGLVDMELAERATLSLDDVALYPLFTDDVLSPMRRLLPDDARRHIATSLIARARQPVAGPQPTGVVGTAGSTLVQHLDDIGAAVDAGGVAVRTLKHVDDVELTVKDIEPGHTTPFHAHPHAHQGVIMTGTGMLHLTGRQLPLAPGDVFSIAPDEPHAIGSDSPDALRLVCLDCFLADPAT